MRPPLRLTPLACLLYSALLGACAVGGPSTAAPSSGASGKADDAADDQACIARGGSYDGVELTRREAELVLDIANKASEEILDHAMGAGLDADTARNIVRARTESGAICNLADLASLPEVGPANLSRARQFSAIWEIAEGGDASVAQLMRDGGTYDGTRFTAGEAFIALEMASYASVSQLDAIPRFRSDVARELVRARRARGGFSSLDEVAEVVGVGSRHMEYLRDGMADWRIFARAAYAQCGSLQADDAIPESLTDVCYGLAIEGETLAGDLEGIAFTQAEAALVLDFVNSADLRTLDAILDARAARALVGERDRAPICDLTRLGNVYFVGPEGLAELRRFSVTWEAHRMGRGSLAELTAPVADRPDDAGPISVHEARVILDMANTATEEQLDAIPGFRSDAARNVAAAQRNGIRSLAALDDVTRVGGAHVRYMADAVNDWRAFLREAEGRPACSALSRGEPGPAAPAESILTDREAEKVRRSLDDICGDTWCEGDFNWRVEEISCPGDGSCSVAMRTHQYGGFSPDVLVGRSPESLRSSGEGDYGPFEATIDGSFEDEDGTWLRVGCDMDGGFLTREDAMNVDRGRYSERLYYSLLDCVSALEEMMWAL